MKIKMKLIVKLGSVKPLSNHTNTFDKEQGRLMYEQEQIPVSCLLSQIKAMIQLLTEAWNILRG